MRSRAVFAIAMITGAVALSGCQDAREAFGFARNTPDEFAVVSRAPLSLPPDYSLRPPRPGAPRPQEGTPRQAAQTVVFGADSSGSVSAITPASTGEEALLQRSGASQANPDIRQVVNRENQSLAEADRNFVDYLMFWRDAEPIGTVVDPAAEAQRLAQNQARGVPANEGTVPIIERKRRAPLEGIF